jgi:vanadium-dependent haloperoxidase-like protein
MISKLLGFGNRRRRHPGHCRNSTCRPVLEALEHRCLLSGIDPILEWNAVALEVNRVSYSGGVINDQIGPTRSSRALAIVHTAMFDAWNSIHRDYTPYFVQALNTSNASDEAAVAQAAHDTLVAMYPHQQPLIDTALAQTLSRVPDGIKETRGIAVGQYVAQAILAARTNDGSEVAGSYVPDGQIGHHDVDPLNPEQGFLTPAWGDVTPFAIPDIAAIGTPPVPDITSAEYTAAYDQVKSLGEEHSSTRTTDQTELAIYWGYDVARGLGDPPRLYNQIARVIAVQQGNTVGANARLFALINISMADAGIQCWGVKYRDVFWRPIVAIRNGGAGEAGDTDGNPDTVGDVTWGPLGAPRTNPLPGEDVNFTPPFPAYTSGHATFGGAAFKMMANFYRADDISFSIPFDFISDEFNGVSRDIHDAIPELVLDHVRQIRPRHYESFSQAAAENAASRIFLGIHWRFDAVEGISAGNRIADYAYDHMLRPSHGSSRFHVPSVDFAAQVDSYLDGSYTTSFPTNPAPGPETPESMVAAIVSLITAPGQFVPSMMARLQPRAEEVMTHLWNTSKSFQEMVRNLDHAAELDGHAENPSLAIMEAQVSNDVFEAIDFLDPFALGILD